MVNHIPVGPILVDRAEAATSVGTLASGVSRERLGVLLCSVAQTVSKSDRGGVPRAIFTLPEAEQRLKRR